MIANKRFWLALAAALTISCGALSGAAHAQATASAIATARELVEAKGGGGMFDPIIQGVVDQARTTLLRTSPQLSKDLNEVATQLVAEFAPKRTELIEQAAKFYAARFSEQELKDMVVFYKTALGKKMLAQEPLVLDETFNYVQQWAPRVAEQVLSRFRAEMKKRGHEL